MNVPAKAKVRITPKFRKKFSYGEAGGRVLVTPGWAELGSGGQRAVLGLYSVGYARVGRWWPDGVQKGKERERRGKGEGNEPVLVGNPS
jgi:hypothetical protein